MHILVEGASRGLGLEVTRQALEAGYQVRAMARSASKLELSNPLFESVRGDALKSRDVEAALIGIDVVIQTLGIGFSDLFKTVSIFSEATRVLVAAMKRQRIRRLICVTGFGAGDSGANISPLQRIPFQAIFGRAYQDKTRQEDLIKASGLDWTIARPGVLTGGKRTRLYKILDDAPQWRNGIISRSDVADFILKQISDETYLLKTPVLVN